MVIMQQHRRLSSWQKNVVHHIVFSSSFSFTWCDATDLLLVLDGGGALSAGLLLRLALLQEGLGDQDVVLGGDGTVGTRLVRSPAYH